MEDRHEIDKQLRKTHWKNLIILYKNRKFHIRKKGTKWRPVQNPPWMGYYCDNECGIMGNYSMYKADGKAMCPACAAKFYKEQKC